MNTFITENFLLDTDDARALYQGYAKDQPIFDYHCHLPPQAIAENVSFNNLYDIWLKGDHYKWRAMRTNGVEEKYCTGQDIADFDKFQAWAATVPHLMGNPLYHWTHLELRRPFGISDCLLGPSTAESIWNRCNEMLATPAFSARSLITQMNVKMIGTTDDPIDTLEHHQKIAKDSSFKTKVLPSWRPDKSFLIEAPTFVDYLQQLGQAADVEIRSFTDLCQALTLRMDHFAAHGCKIADHALDVVLYAKPSEQVAQQALQLRLQGKSLTPEQIASFRTSVLVFLASEYHRRGWVQQYHIGALRNANSYMMDRMGPDIGFDSIQDAPIARPLASLLDEQARQNQLPKTILYCLNPSDNEVIATMAGNFQGGGVAGKIQFGSGWWFNDQKDGMIRQMTQLAQLGLLSRFVGMLTDSRSFLSYTRHEYFRRILCRMLGRWMEQGEIPREMELIGNMVENICFHNAKNYFEIELL